jgi:hypothetical protein
MSDRRTEELLEECQETIRELQEENANLRAAAGAFGHLAERLNETLRERRLQADRRQTIRDDSDRRGEAGSSSEA